MSTHRIIAVVGATGAQGGGLARALLQDPKSPFRVRALTRTPTSDAARRLAEQGAELVTADLDDLDSLVRAFEGAYGAFCVTNYWEHHSPDREHTQATNLAEAARRAGLQHVIWSTLEDTRQWMALDDDRMPTLMERYKVPHLDAKGESNHVFTERGVPTTFLLTSFYWENLLQPGMLAPGPDGAVALTLPMGDAKLPGIAAEDIGRCAAGIFRAGPERYAGRTIGIAGEHLTGSQMTSALANSLGMPVHYHAVEPAVYRTFGFPGADDLGNMFQFKRDFNADFCDARNVSRSRRLNPDLQSFNAWLAANKDQFRAPQTA